MCGIVFFKEQKVSSDKRYNNSHKMELIPIENGVEGKSFISLKIIILGQKNIT